ncbi:glycosyl hydrolase [Bacteroides sp.]|uniref:glycosyl hydrolase n=1 Tax=Bacteroides sp. TaxID=29523 RepID=UPI00261ACBBA|nr:glycosyl hydrolase [Bacteroides sp.]
MNNNMNIGIRNIGRLLAGLFWVSSIFACGGDDNGKGSDEPQLGAPQLVSSTPANGDTDIPDGDLNVVLTYDQNVTTPSGSGVTVSGATVESVSAKLKNVTVRLSGLERGENYKLIVSKGVVLGPTNVEAPQVTISFSTINVPDVKPVAPELCTSNPLPQAKKVYEYLVSVYGAKTLSGSMANVNWNIAEAELVHKTTGKYPAITFFDYIHLYASAPNSWIDYGNTTIVEDWHNQGGLVGAGWHWMVPAYDGAAADDVTYEPEKTTFRPKNAILKGTWENRIIKADLEKIAGYLKLLQEKNIPVIWRPLHEAAGNIYEPWHGTAWFWWGYDGAEVYKKLWIYMFDFFKEKGINNLIWVWTSQLKDADFYPGDAYVDIIGRDIYNQKSGFDNAVQYKSIAEVYSKKLVVLSECGNVATISSQWESGSRWAFFMPWYQYNATTLIGHEHADDKWWIDAMKQDFVVTRDQLPSLK